MGFNDIYINGWIISSKIGGLWYFAGLLVVVVIAYLLGSINSAIIISKVKYKDDIRKHGSGNAGMTNILRTYGKKDAVLTLLGDMLKIAVAVFIARLLCGEEGAYLAGLFGVIGHIFPIYYKFRGGKGVVASATTILTIDWQIFLVLLGLFVIIVAIWRYVSLASVVSGIVYPALVNLKVLVMTNHTAPPTPIMLLFPLFVAIMLIVTHRENIKRIMNRTENKIIFGKKNRENKKYLEPEGTIKYDGKDK
ncbi:MAG: glycerol-3-phosphate 1-O-acyltransferase PlsY [Eubacteriales bacterium]|nr:glycerol-3-phosphate 1-O-acyltransferase PlsY [Eubacteriales bacterium]MDD4476223.1 glycerol-3-phosphate 1-O-acyltransferase PlsY [Eubacteriales bacterium]